MENLQNTVFITHHQNYEEQELVAAVRRHFAGFHIGELLHPGMRVLLKPNLLLKRRPEEATTTHPALVKAVVLCLRELGVTDIVIADSPGGPYSRSYLQPIYEATGMSAVAEQTGAQLYDKCDSFEKKNPDGRQLKEFTLIRALENADFVIDLPKLKTHGMMTLSGGVKNLFGTIPGLMKPEFHWRFPQKEAFAEMLLDLCETVRPGFTLCDGIVAMEGDGPSGGSPRLTGMLLSGVNPYMLDIALCRAVGLTPGEVLTVSRSLERGLCKSEEELVTAGEELLCYGDFQMPRSKSIDFSEHIPQVFRRMVDGMLVSRPVIRKSHCIGCGKCAESCPPKTIAIVDKKARINAKHCIHCFCCHEMCPVRAIHIKRFRIFDF